MLTKEKIAEIRGLCDKATPDEYELRVREFSNKAFPEIWTEYGWLSDLGPTYRIPTYELFVAARTALPLALDEIDRLNARVKELMEAIAEARGLLADDWFENWETAHDVLHNALQEYRCEKHSFVTCGENIYCSDCYISQKEIAALKSADAGKGKE